MKTPCTTRLVRTILAACLLSACAAREPPSPWDARLAPALCTRAESLLENGENDAARAEASRALKHAEAQEDAVSRARALTVLGLVDHAPDQLRESLRLMNDAPAGGDIWEIRLDLARLALDAGALETALEHIELVLEEAPDWPAPLKRARAESRGSHMLATIRREEGQLELAAKHERWAALQLTVLPDHELQDLRQAVAQALGDDCAARALFQEAFRAHARAANLAAKLGDKLARLKASRSMSRDLILLDRLADAVDHYGRTLSLARELDDWNTMESIALEALHWLDSHGEPWDSRRRRLFRDTLHEVSRRPPDAGDDSTPPRG
jgi:tetratricopeptide (TPR) repeat protein